MVGEVGFEPTAFRLKVEYTSAGVIPPVPGQRIELCAHLFVGQGSAPAEKPGKLAPRAGFEPAHFLINSQAHCRFATSESVVGSERIERSA